MKRIRTSNNWLRRAYVVVVAALMMVVIMGFGATAIDMSFVVAAHQELRVATQNTALAVCSALANRRVLTLSEEDISSMRIYGRRIMATNPVAGKRNAHALITIGKIDLNPVTHRFISFSPSSVGDLYNGVKVQAHMSGDSALPSILGSVLGYDDYDMSTSAIAKLPAREFEIVYDHSASMADDSRLEWLYRMVALRQEHPDSDAQLNLREVWAALSFLPEGIDAANYDPTSAGPQFGPPGSFLNRVTDDFGYGTSDFAVATPGAYDPLQDPGLIYLPKDELWDTETLVRLNLIEPDGAGGYAATGVLQDSSGQPLNYEHHIRRALANNLVDVNGDGSVDSMDQTFILGAWGACPAPCAAGDPGDTCSADLNGDCTVDTVDLSMVLAAQGSTIRPESLEQWTRRVAVALGLFDWTPVSTEDATVSDWDSGELSMLNTSGGRVYAETFNQFGFKWSKWIEVMEDFLPLHFPNFRKAFGVKTLANYVIHQSLLGILDLHAAPLQPDRAVKDAVQAFLDQLPDITDSDYVGLTVFSTPPSVAHVVDLRAEENYDDVVNRLDQFQPRGSTGTPMAMLTAMNYLLYGTGALNEPAGQTPRRGTHKVIILVTDGQANFPAGEAGAWNTLFAEGGVADQLDQNSITVHALTLGANGHWNDPCTDDAYAEAWHRVRYPGNDSDADGCGIGQSLAYMTGGESVRIEGFWGDIPDTVLEAFIDKVSPPSGRPFLVAIGE